VKTGTKWLVYGAIPLVLSATLQGMYFSGNLVLQRLACPKLPPLSPDAYREFGLVENVQNLLLIAMLAILVAGVMRSRARRLRWAYGALACFTLFVCLEEIDYGTHFYAYLTAEQRVGWFEPANSEAFQAVLSQTDFRAEPFNLHNQGDLTDLFKALAGALILGLFVIAPFFDRRVNNPWIRYFLADRFVLVTVVVMVLMRLLTDQLADWEEGVLAAREQDPAAPYREKGAMNNNLSEFREVLTYYLFLVYLGVLVFLRREPASPAD
jgi:hypothetical protein